MFSIHQKQDNDKEYIVLANTRQDALATVCLNEGARVKDLMLNGKSIIQEQPDFDYKDSYASSILFPFVSRLENGIYNFQNNTYQLNKNDKEINALHGLVYDKKFEVFEIKEHQDKCVATFKYFENNPPKGFPFKYELLLSYTLYKGEFQVTLSVNNLDSAAFPFTIGWHPYFNCQDFSDAYLNFRSNKKLIFNDNLITKSIDDYIIDNQFSLENKQLDDCFILSENGIDFINSHYHIKISSDALENYLQLYTPKNKPIIAIEPMTGVSNSLNNEIGLQILEPNNTYTVNFKIEMIQ